jgi:hypothetical protein
MVEVIFTTSIVGPTVSYSSGRQYFLPKEEAKSYLDFGYCELVPVKQEKVKTTAKIKK